MTLLCYLDMQFLQLPLVRERRGIRHHIAGGLVLREGDHFADVGLVGQQHHQPVNARGYPAMRRRAVFEGLQHVPELELGFFFFDAEQVENLRLDVAPVDTDRTGGHFIAVADHIVRLRKNCGWVGLEPVKMLQARHGERMVCGVPFLELLVPLEHREIQHERKGHHVRISQLKGVPEPDPQRTQNLVDYFRVVSDEQDQVAVRCAGEFGQGCYFRLADELGHGAFQTLSRQRQGDQSLRSDFFGGRRQIVELLAGVIWRSPVRRCT